MPMTPVHHRHQRIRGNRGLPQRVGLFPVWIMKKKRQCGGWLSGSVMRAPGFDLAQRLPRRYKNPRRPPNPSRRR